MKPYLYDRQRHARREKGKLYEVASDAYMDPTTGKFGAIAWHRSIPGTTTGIVFAPAGAIVLYLGTANKTDVRVLFNEKVLRINRMDLSVEPISFNGLQQRTNKV